MIKLKSIDDVVEWQLCTGCGMCSALEPQRYEMTDASNFGIRPKIRPNAKPELGEAFKHCPGHRLKHSFQHDHTDFDRQLLDGWGPVLEVWEGYASDEEIRFKGSSGGAATALASFGLHLNNSNQVLHVAGRSDIPYLNETVFSYSKEDLLFREGSRYSPASPCEKIGELGPKAKNTIFIGKPCDVAAVSSWESSSCDNSLAIKIGFFCAGVPSTKGNLDLIDKVKLNKANIKSLKFRGEGWPGLWKACDGDGNSSELTYAESWGFLQSFRQWRCYICPDHTAEFADIAVSDPWYRDIQPGESGSSLIIARTKKGLEYLRAAQNAGFIVLKQNDSALLPASQPNLMKTRGMLWARLIVLKFLGGAVPNYDGFKLFKFWLQELPLKEKIQSFTGTVKRVFRKSLNKRINVF